MDGVESRCSLSHKCARVANTSLAKAKDEKDHPDQFDRPPVSQLDNRFRPPHALCCELRYRMG